MRISKTVLKKSWEVMKMMSRFSYSLKQAFKQIRRNKGMTVTSFFAITAMMIILGIFFMLIVNINTAAETVKNDYNNIEVFFKDEVSMDQINATKADVEKWEQVDTVTVRTKAEALEILKVRWGDNGYLLDGLSTNPLPNSIVITVDSLDKADAVAAKAEKITGAEDVNFYKDTVEKLVAATRGFQIAAVIVMAILILVSIIVVSNTIKLTVFNRSDEIIIMKYVGATNWFIRAPFLLEGILIGFFSAIISSGLIVAIYASVKQFIGADVLSILSVSLVPLGFLAFNLVLIFIALGISIGAWGSMISMRRFLDTK